MNKRIVSFIVCIAVLLALGVTSFASSGDAVKFTVEANKTAVVPGDELSFTVYLEQTGKTTAFEGVLDIPTGLTYVANSCKIVDNAKASLGFDDISWTESSVYFNAYGATPYEGSEKITIATFFLFNFLSTNILFINLFPISFFTKQSVTIAILSLLFHYYTTIICEKNKKIFHKCIEMC